MMNYLATRRSTPHGHQANVLWAPRGVKRTLANFFVGNGDEEVDVGGNGTDLAASSVSGFVEGDPNRKMTAGHCSELARY
jgi:hypothetical protein